MIIKWLRDPNNFRIESPIKVCDLFIYIPGCQEWNVELIQELFNDRDCHEILNIPLYPVGEDDKRMHLALF